MNEVTFKYPYKTQLNEVHKILEKFSLYFISQYDNVGFYLKSASNTGFSGLVIHELENAGFELLAVSITSRKWLVIYFRFKDE